MRKTTTIFIILFVLAGGAVLVWRSYASGPLVETKPIVHPDALTELTAEDIEAMLRIQAGAGTNELPIAANAEARQAFLKGLREYLALAAEARSRNMHEDKEFRANFAYKTDRLLADLYLTKLSREAGKQYLVPADEIEAVWSEPRNEELFTADMEILRAIQIETARLQGSEIIPAPLAAGSLERARKNWARTKIFSKQAREDADFMSRPEVSLRIRVLEAGILSSDLLRAVWPERIAATESEISSFIATHPEYNLDKKMETAADVLRRARSGENLAALATEYTEHRPSKDTGGSVELSDIAEIWPELAAAVRKLQPGETADSLVETESGFHIVRREGETTLRHILFQHRFEGPRLDPDGPPPPFMTAAEIAKIEVERQKRDNFVSDIIKRYAISMPEEITG